MDRSVRFLSPDVYLPGSIPIAALTLLGSLLAAAVVSESDDSSWPSLGISLKCLGHVTTVLFSTDIPFSVGVGDRGIQSV